MRSYLIKYAFIGPLNAVVHSGAMIRSLISGTESEALVSVKQALNGRWRTYGNNVEVVITEIKKQ